MGASRWEILGAWLHIWTPPRDVEIPPFPRRVGLAALAALAVAIGLFLALVVPTIDDGRQRRAARDARAIAAAQGAERARLMLDQRPRTARAARAARLYAAGQAAQARAALLEAVRASVGRDARDRVAAGAIERPVSEVRCRYLAGGGGAGAGARVRLACFAVTTRTADAAVGQPFVAAGSLRDGRYTWCHENPRPAEGASGVGVQVALSRVCSGR